MGGIFALGAERDFDRVQDLCLSVARLWKQAAANEFGFGIYISPLALKICCDNGGRILGDYFPIPPGPFKRIATLIVLGRLDPFFHFEPQLDRGAMDRWLPKILTLLISPGLAKLRVNMAVDPTKPLWQKLDAWETFPSAHYKQEFFQFLEGMDSFSWLEGEARSAGFIPTNTWEYVLEARAARMISAVALSLESCYYWNEDSKDMGTSSPLRGKCADFFDPSDVNFRKEFEYDRVIYTGIERSKASP